MLTHDTDDAVKPPATIDNSARALRLIRRIERRYGLDRAAPQADAHTGPGPESMQLNREQMLVNEALVAKIFQCERAESALRASQKKLHELLAHQLRMKEDERKRVSVEIHDMLGQNLLALRLDVASLHQRTGAAQPRLHEWAASALVNIDDTLNGVRALIAGLRPFEVELGIEAAVEWELGRFRRTSGIDCHAEMDGRAASLALSDEQVIALYRALQECLGNVLQHANASRVDVVVFAGAGTLTMTVSDNGVGLHPPRRGAGGGFGLMAVRERVAALGGSVTVRGVRSHGTSVTVCVPVARPQ